MTWEIYKYIIIWRIYAYVQGEKCLDIAIFNLWFMKEIRYG